jgi:hypothetical protein
MKRAIQSTSRVLAAGIGIAAGAYAGMAACAWHRYGRFQQRIAITATNYLISSCRFMK